VLPFHCFFYYTCQLILTHAHAHTHFSPSLSLPQLLQHNEKILDPKNIAMAARIWRHYGVSDTRWLGQQPGIDPAVYGCQWSLEVLAAYLCGPTAILTVLFYIIRSPWRWPLQCVSATAQAYGVRSFSPSPLVFRRGGKPLSLFRPLLVHSYDTNTCLAVHHLAAGILGKAALGSQGASSVLRLFLRLATAVVHPPSACSSPDRPQHVDHDEEGCSLRR